jgi:ABC-type transport system substrate-binding protein
MVAANSDPGRKTGEVAQAQFEKLGFKIRFRTASDDALGTKFCALPAAKVAICPNFSFTRDYNDPHGLLDAVFNGRNIAAANNPNWSRLDDPALNRAMDAAARVLDELGPQLHVAEVAQSTARPTSTSTTIAATTATTSTRARKASSSERSGFSTLRARRPTSTRSPT